MWKQLHLTATRVQSYFDRNTACFIITTHLAHVHASRVKRRLHKLNVDVPFHDVRPPRGLTEVSCQAIHLILTLSHLQQRKRKSNEITDDFHGSLDEYEREASQSLVVDINEDRHDPQWRHASDLENSITDRYSHGEDEMLLDSWCEPDIHDALMPVDLIRLDCSGSATDQVIPPRPRQTSSVCVHEAVTKGNCLLAIEAAVKLAICGSLPHRKSQLSLSKSRSIHALSDLMPAIWSPNFLPDFASRAVFIPTIAHALNSVLGIREGGVEASLWKNARANLQSKTAARKLSPLAEAAEDTAADRHAVEGHFDVSEEALDEDEMLEVDGRSGIVLEEHDSWREDVADLGSLSDDDILDDGEMEEWDIQTDPMDDIEETIVLIET